MRKIEIDWDPLRQTTETVPEGTAFEACVLTFDDDWPQLIISRKAAQDTPFDKYAMSHRVGDIVEAEIHEITGTVVVVRLTGGLRGEIPLGLVPILPEPPADLIKKWGLAKGDFLKTSITGFDGRRLCVKLDLADAVRRIDAERASMLFKWRGNEVVSQIESAETAMAIMTPLPRSAPRSRLTVLLVDDEEEIQFGLAGSLKDRGHRVLTTTRACDADREIEASNHIDVAIIDQQLSDGVGLDLLARVASKFPQARRILFTGNPQGIGAARVPDIQLLVKPLDTAEIIAAIEGQETVDSVERLWVGDESAGNLCEMPSAELHRQSNQVRPVLVNFLSALQEPFKKSKIAILRLQKSTNRVECLCASDFSPSVIDQYADKLRFSFIGNVLDGQPTRYFRLDRNGFKADEPLRPLLNDVKAKAIYGVPLKVESQPNPMGVFAFLPDETESTPAVEVREFQQTVRALALAIDRATLDAQLFKNQRVMVAGSLVLGMAHELRNQVQSLTSMADYLLAMNDPSPPVVDADSELNAEPAIDVQKVNQDGLARFKHHTKLLQNQLESVLGLTRGTKEERIPLRTLLSDVTDQCEGTAKTYDVYLKVDLADDASLDAPVMSSLRQVVMNLLLNAIQHVSLFRKRHTGFVRLSARQQQVSGSREIAIRVEDNAFGLDWATSSQLFQPFYTTRSHGTGLGLSVAHMIAESQGGQLLVESSFKYLGTTMLLRLPATGVE